MAVVLKDRVKETTSTTGTADFVLGGSASGYQTFSVIGPNNYTYYCAYDQATGDWEVGYGQYTTAAGGTLVRDTVLSNSAATTNKISFAAGPKDVFITYPAEKAIYEEDAGNVLIDGGPITVIGNGVTGYTTFSAALGEMYGDVDQFAQFYAQNLNDGTEASADMIVYRDNTVVDTANFLDMGINSSNFSSATWPIFTPSSMYLYGDGGEMFVGSGTDDVIFFAGGVDVSDEAARFDKTTKNLTTVADVNVGGDLNATGGTFTAPVTSTSTSVLSPANNEFVTKAYVDNAASAGLHIHTPVAAETSAALSAVYVQGGTTFNITDITGTNTVVTSTTHGLAVDDEIWLTTTAGNGLSINTPYFVYATPTTTSLQLTATWNGPLLTGLTNASGLSYATRANSGVGAYLEASANEALPISGVTTNDRVLVYNQSTGYWNGVYTVTALGANDPGGSKWKLTRATDADFYSPASTNGLSEGDYFFVQSNSEAYVLTTTGPIIIGYTAITYTLFSSVPSYIVNAPLNLTGNTLSLTGTVAATNGGTGTNTVTTGDLLYGAATNTWSKLPAGAAYRSLVMNASGTNVEWNAVALNQSGAVSGSLPATNGGTGQNAYAVGDMLYSSATNTLTVLSGNTTTTKKFLGQTGTGSTSAAPVWEQPAASDITGLAASATTDTTNASNISSGTLGTARLSGSYTGVTGVGTLTAGTWNANTVGPTYGGTGFASYAVGDLLYADTTTSLAKLADVAVGNALISGGVSSAPSWGKVGLATHVSGTLPLANGGTGQASAQAAMNALAGATTAGQYLRGDGTNVTMSAIQASDIPSLSGTYLPLTGGTLTGTLTGTTIAGAFQSTNARIQFTAADADGGSFALLGLNWGGTAGTYKNFEVYDYVNGRSMVKLFGDTRNLQVFGACNPEASSTLTASTWLKWALVTSGVTAQARLGSDGNGLNFTTNALFSGSWVEDDPAKKKFAYIQHLGNGRHEWRTAAAGTGISWVTSLTADENGAAVTGSLSATGAITQNGIQVLNANNYTSYVSRIADSGGSGAYVSLSSGNELEYFNSGGTIQPLYLQYSGDNNSLRGPGGSIILNASNYTGYSTFSGAISGASLLTSAGVSDTYSGIRVVNPGGGSLATSSGAVTGAIKIKLPTATLNSSTMLRITVKVYEYSTGMSTTFEVGGYNYVSGNWYNYFATQVSQSRGDITVRFGQDATSDCIWIGDTNTTWQYPQVFITDVQCGYSNYTQAAWSTGWGVSFVTSFDTIEQTTTAYRYLSSGNYGGYSTFSGTISTSQSAQATAYLGGISASWGGTAYPTLYSSASDRWVMHINPHISYVANGTNGYTGSMTGATIRMAANTSASTYWDVGVGTNGVGADTFSIGRAGSNFLKIDSSANLTSTGNVTAYSDERVKTNWRGYDADFVERLAKVKHGTYDRTDIELTQDGASAQSLQTLLPNSVVAQEDDKLAVNYGGAAMVSAIQLAQRVVEQDKRIAKLEALVAELLKRG